MVFLRNLSWSNMQIIARNLPEQLLVLIKNLQKLWIDLLRAQGLSASIGCPSFKIQRP